eukprot:7387232-Prymnesium_polylepis.1
MLHIVLLPIHPRRTGADHVFRLACRVGSVRPAEYLGGATGGPAGSRGRPVRSPDRAKKGDL